MNRHSLLLGVLSLSALVGSVACSSPAGDPSSFQPSGPSESDPGAASSADSGAAAAPPGTVVTPMPISASPDAASPRIAPVEDDDAAAGTTGTTPPPVLDAGPPAAVGTLLATGLAIALDGITDDGFVVYSSGERAVYGVHAVPLAGGTNRLIASGPTALTEVSGSAVFLSPRSLVTPLLRPLDVWTNAHGLERLTSSLSSGSPVVASPDGTTAAFFSGQSPELTIESSDGTGSHALAPLCATALTLRSSGSLLATDCAAPLGDGGPPPSSLSVFGEPRFAETLSTPYASYSLDPTGAWIWLLGSDARGRLVRASDGATLFDDADVTGPGIFDASGSTLFYVARGALKRLPMSRRPLPETILPTGCSEALALSPDGQELLLRRGGELVLLSDAGKGTASPVPTVARRPYTGFEFSSDSQYLVARSAGLPGSWAYEAIPVTRRLAPVVFGDLKSLTLLAGSKALAIDTAGDASIVDLSRADVGESLPGLAELAVSKDLAQIAYVARAVDVPGLYVVSATEAGTLH